jgi:hypothetical protein
MGEADGGATLSGWLMELSPRGVGGIILGGRR